MEAILTLDNMAKLFNKSIYDLETGGSPLWNMQQCN